MGAQHRTWGYVALHCMLPAKTAFWYAALTDSQTIPIVSTLFLQSMLNHACWRGCQRYARFCGASRSCDQPQSMKR